MLVLPDMLANAGGVVVSYFEWVQGLQEYFWKEEEVNARLNDIVTRAFRETSETHGRSQDEHAHRLLRARCPARRRGDHHAGPVSLESSSTRAEGCHLCERVLEVVDRVCAGDFERVDIGGDPELEAALPHVDPRRRDRRRARLHLFRPARGAAAAAEGLLTVPAACRRRRRHNVTLLLQTEGRSDVGGSLDGRSCGASLPVPAGSDAGQEDGQGPDFLAGDLGLHEHQRHPDPA